MPPTNKTCTFMRQCLQDSTVVSFDLRNRLVNNIDSSSDILYLHGCLYDTPWYCHHTLEKNSCMKTLLPSRSSRERREASSPILSSSSSSWHWRWLAKQVSLEMWGQLTCSNNWFSLSFMAPEETEDTAPHTFRYLTHAYWGCTLHWIIIIMFGGCVQTISFKTTWVQAELMIESQQLWWQW